MVCGSVDVRFTKRPRARTCGGLAGLVPTTLHGRLLANAAVRGGSGRTAGAHRAGRLGAAAGRWAGRASAAHQPRRRGPANVAEGPGACRPPAHSGVGMAQHRVGACDLCARMGAGGAYGPAWRAWGSGREHNRRNVRTAVAGCSGAAKAWGSGRMTGAHGRRHMAGAHGRRAWQARSGRGAPHLSAFVSTLVPSGSSNARNAFPCPSGWKPPSRSSQGREDPRDYLALTRTSCLPGANRRASAVSYFQGGKGATPWASRGACSWVVGGSSWVLVGARGSWARMLPNPVWTRARGAASPCLPVYPRPGSRSMGMGQAARAGVRGHRGP
jgi:hypothetical protein